MFWHLTIPVLHFDNVKWWKHLTKKSHSTKNAQTFSHANINSFDIYIHFIIPFSLRLKSDKPISFFFSSSIPFSAHSYFKKVSFYCIRLNHTVLFFISTMFGTCWLLRTVFIFHFLFRLLLDFIFFQQRIVIITCKLTWIYRTFGYNRCIKLNHLVSQSKLQTAFANIDVIWCIESAEK